MRPQRKSQAADNLHDAKNALLDALRCAEAERLPQALIRRIESLTAKAEVLEHALKVRTQGNEP